MTTGARQKTPRIAAGFFDLPQRVGVGSEPGFCYVTMHVTCTSMLLGAGKKFDFMPCDPPASARGSYTPRHLLQRSLIVDQGAFFTVSHALAAVLDTVHVLDLDYLVPQKFDVAVLATFVVTLHCPEKIVHGL